MLDINKKELLAKKIIEMGEKELNRIKQEMDTDKYKINFTLSTHRSEELTCVVISDELLHKEYKKKFGIFNRKKSKIDFEIKYVLTHEEKDKNMLKEILYEPNDIDIKEIEKRYGINEDDCILILSLLHELAHAQDILLDMYQHHFLKRTADGSVEFLLFMYMTRDCDEQERNIQYRELPREKYADDNSIKFFKENFEEIVNFYKTLA